MMEVRQASLNPLKPYIAASSRSYREPDQVLFELGATIVISHRFVQLEGI